jgi:hypothetical protein
MRGLLGALAALIFLSGSALILSRLVTQPDTTRSPTGAWTTPQTATPTPTSPAPTGPVFVEPTPIPSASTTTRTKSPALAFELVGSVPELHVTVGPLGTEPVRASTPNGSAPRATVDGDTVRLVVPANGGDRLDVRLNERIAWAVRVSGGVRSASFELAGATLRRLDLAGGAALLEMALPAEKQTIPIRMSGGVNTWRITTARKVPVRVVLRRGGGEVVLNGHSVHGVARNTTLNDRVAGSGAAGLDIEAVAGLGTLTIGTRGTP